MTQLATMTQAMSTMQAIREFVSAMPAGEDFCIRDITNRLRDRVNRGELTLTDMPVNVSQDFKHADGTFERQTVTYNNVRAAFMTLLTYEFSALQSRPEPNGRYRIFTKPVDTAVGASASVSDTRSFAEKILDGTITEVCRVVLNGKELDAFETEQDARNTLVAKLSKVYKNPNDVLETLIDDNKLEFVDETL